MNNYTINLLINLNSNKKLNILNHKIRNNQICNNRILHNIINNF